MSKTIVVTGSNSGFGRLTVETLARAGHQVFATMRGSAGRNAAAAAELSAWAKGGGLRVHVVELDVTSDASVEQAGRTIAEAAGQCVDVVVNNAGQFSAGVQEAYLVSQVQDLFNVNVFGPMRVNRAFLPLMRRRRQGLIIQVSSVVGVLPMPFLGPYSATKAAVEAHAYALSKELKSLGVESVVVQPGAFPTDIGSKAPMPSDASRLAEYGELAGVPGRMFEGLGQLFASPNRPDPQDVADAVARLVDMAPGTRPLQTVVDKLSGSVIEAANAAHSASQAQLAAGFGLA